MVVNKAADMFVLVGEAGYGRTKLLLRFALGYLPTHNVPTVFENYSTVCT
jgi:Rho family protein